MKVINQNNVEQLVKVFDLSQLEYQDVNQVVQNIISKVRLEKDEAIKEFTQQFDKVKLDNIKVTEIEVEEAFKRTPPELINDLKQAKNNIKEYHEMQFPKEYEIKKNGAVLKQLIRPIERIGMYVPGGTASYPSTVLMNAIPAKIAGVKKLVMVTPPNKQGNVDDILLVAAKIAEVDEIYKVGGAQSIAALAFGTESIPKVDKIVGPGNIYVSMAKKILNGFVGIDMIAGPSEIVVIADTMANIKFIAADLLSQAEHDTLSKVILITNRNDISQILDEIQIQTDTLERKAIIEECLENNGYIIQVDTIDKAIEIANKIAPEHLELLCENPDSYVSTIQNAGAVFVGEYSPEPVGDYFAGPNHTLPTSGNARFQSVLSVTDFLKTMSYISYSKEALDISKNSIIRIAEKEGLSAHSNSIKVRYQ